MKSPLPPLAYAIAAIMILYFASRSIVASLGSVEKLLSSLAP